MMKHAIISTILLALTLSGCGLKGSSAANSFQPTKDIASTPVSDGGNADLGCASFPSADIAWNTDPSQFAVTLSVADASGQTVNSFAQGDTVSISITITNNATSTKCFPFSTSAQYDFAAKSNTGSEVWRWSDGVAFTQATSSFTLAPGETKTFTGTWDKQLLRSGTVVPVGSYTMRGEVGSLSSQVVQFDVVAPNVTYIGCGGFSASDIAWNTDPRLLPLALSVTDKFAQSSTTFAQGDPITITETVSNKATTTKCFPFASGYQYDFTITATDGSQIWRWSNDMMFTQSVTSFTLPPGATKTFTTTWNQVLPTDNSLIPLGNYTVHGYLGSLTSAPVQFGIQ